MSRKDPPKSLAVVRDQYDQRVPREGQLEHPLQPKARSRKTGQLSMADLISPRSQTDFTIPVQEWTSRTFVDYFARRIQEVTGGNAKRTYVSDCPAFTDIGRFFSSNGLDKNEWTRTYIEWALSHYADIKKQIGSFTAQALANSRVINNFYQNEVMARVDTGEIERKACDTTLLEEIQEAHEAGKRTEVFARFGIPVAATYLIRVLGVPADTVVEVVEERMRSLAEGAIRDRETLERIFKASILASPYPKEFSMLDWRVRLSDLVENYQDYGWWRQEDYGGKPLPKYWPFLESNPSGE